MVRDVGSPGGLTLELRPGPGQRAVRPAGLDHKDALATASIWPRRFLGAPATADIVTYHHDPGQLARPAAVVAGGVRLR